MSKGGEIMTGVKRLKKLIHEHGGIMTTSIAEENNIHREYLNSLVKDGELERVSRGIYITPEVWEDRLLINQLKRTKMIYSHETALYLHDLTDRDPLKYVVTVPQGYNPLKLKAEKFIIHTTKKEWFELGVCTKKTIFGNEVKTYDMERTICDLIRSRSRIEIQTFQGALKSYARRKDKNLRALMQYAGMFKVETILRQYLEVLL